MREPVKRLTLALLAVVLLGLALTPASTFSDVAIWARASLPKLTITQGPLLLPNGSKAAPSLAFTNFPTTGLFKSAAGAGNTSYSAGGSDVLELNSSGLVLVAAGQLLWGNAASIASIGSYDVRLSRHAVGHAKVTTDGTTLGTWSTGTLYAEAGKVTAGSGTGVTVNETANVRSVIYKVTVLRTNCVAAATTCDLTIATLPAKTFLKAVIADLTTTYACTAVCTTATLSGTLGTTAGGTELLASMDLDAATAQFGDADAELGASLNAAARTANGALFNGVLMSWASTTTVTYRITSGTGNLGDGAATNLSQGTMVFYLVTEVFP